MKFKNHLIAAGALAALSLSAPVYSALSVIERPAQPASATEPAPAVVVIPEGTRLRDDNIRMRDELDRMTSELAQVQAELAASKASDKACQDKLAHVNVVLDDIERRMEAVGEAMLRINFAANSSKLEPSPEASEALIVAGKKARRIDVRGHADSAGSVEGNQRMALRRALAAKKFLTEHGVAANKVFVFSRGSFDPAASNDTAEGRATNRRVEITFMP
jgi:peptidoglycan-associated lipoprotein